MVPLRPKETSAVLALQCASKRFAGLRPIGEALQQASALHRNAEILLTKQRLSRSACYRRTVVGSCYRECMRSCLVFVVSCKPTVWSYFFFFFSPPPPPPPVLCTESVTFLLHCMSQAETDWHLSLQDLWIFCSYKLQIIAMQSETWTPLREQKVRSVKYQEGLSYLFTA